MVKIPVIYYHSVAPQKHPTWAKNYLTTNLKDFEAHLKFLKFADFQTLSFDEYLEIRENNFSKKKYCVLTFDDGYIDNYIYAYPLLKKYGFKGTIFINPESVPEEIAIGPSLFDYWDGKSNLKNLERWGFLNWEQMRLMEKNKVMEIHSHTLTHTKYFVSDKIIGFHHPGADSLYYIGNLYPELIPYYISYVNFEKLIPYGYPIFEQKSAIIAPKVEINPDFIKNCLFYTAHLDWSKNNASQIAYKKIMKLYKEYLGSDNIILKREDHQQYKSRVITNFELSKKLIDKNLSKNTTICCWPHGDNNQFVHNQALKLGFKATTLGKMPEEFLDSSRFERIAIGHKFGNAIFDAKIRCYSYMGLSPYYQIINVLRYIKYSRGK
jgi:hypothetical protein